MEVREPIEKEGLVVFMDALGTKELILTGRYKDAMKRWDELLKGVIHSMGWSEYMTSILREAGSDNPEMTSGVKALQDTVILYLYPEDQGTDLRVALARASRILGRFLWEAMEDFFDAFFFRWAVEVGTIMVGSTQVFSPAAVAAHESQDTADWTGIIAAPAASALLRPSLNDPAQHRFFARYPIPLKDGETMDGFVLSWPAWADPGPCRKIMNRRMTQFPEPHKRRKYENALAFAEWYWTTYPKDDAHKGESLSS